MNTKFVVFMLLATFAISEAAFSCKDSNGDDVDWWMIVKQPMVENSSEEGAGLLFGYADASNPDSFEIPDGTWLTDDSSALMKTMKQVADASSSDYAAIYFNDQPLNIDWHVGLAYAHAKGWMAFDNEQGFFMTHSAPHHPTFSDEGDLELSLYSGSQYYGQHWFCMSASVSTLDNIASNQRNSFPLVYQKNFPESFQSVAPNAYKFAMMDKDGLSDVTSDIEFNTLGGASMKNFAHNGTYDDEFYATYLEPKLDSGLLVQSWIRPGLPSYCPSKEHHDDINVEKIYMKSGFEWTSYNDHSKWAISTTETSPYVCLNDNNRMSSQDIRGGGSTCFENSKLWGALNNIISATDKTEGNCDPQDDKKAETFLSFN